MGRIVGIMLGAGLILGPAFTAARRTGVPIPRQPGTCTTIPRFTQPRAAWAASTLKPSPPTVDMTTAPSTSQASLKFSRLCPRPGSPLRVSGLWPEAGCSAVLASTAAVTIRRCTYASQLPQGQLYWPGSAIAPGYTPFSRYQTYGSGYNQSPYGSNFYGGYYKGFPMAFPMIGD